MPVYKRCEGRTNESAKLTCVVAMSAFVLLATPVGLVAQEQQPVSTSDLAAQHNQNAIRVPDGTVVRLLVVDSVSGKTAKTEDAVQLRVLDEVKVGDLVVIANKAPALAYIAELQYAGRRQRAGTISIKFDHVALVTGQTHKLRGFSATKGGAGNASEPVSPYLLVFSLPFFPLAHGEEALLGKGTVLTAALDGDALLDSASVTAHQPPPSPRKEGPASITLYWLAAQSRTSDQVFCGTVKLANLSLGRNFTVHLPAGSYWFRTWDKNNAIHLPVGPGGEYFLRVSPFARNHLDVVEHDVGEVEAAETRPLEFNKILDVRAASLNELQADPIPRNDAPRRDSDETRAGLTR